MNLNQVTNNVGQVFDRNDVFKSDAYMKLMGNVKASNLVNALKRITTVDFTNMTSEEKQKAKYAKIFKREIIKKKKIRIFEKGLRVRDFSFFNSEIELLDNGSVIFHFTNLGEERNEVIINDLSDIYFSKHGFICINVNGPVYYADGTRRYEGRRDDL